MKVGNIVATFKIFLHLNYKNRLLLFYDSGF